MALDEALLRAPAPMDPEAGVPEAGAPPVTCRLYSWWPDTLSLGYFQRVADVPAAAAFLGLPGADPEAPQPGALVRRLTGGGAIHHQGELTFSLTTSLEHPLYRGPVAASYERIHGAIAAALAAAGVESRPRADREPASETAGTGMCFHHSSPVDLVWDERKGVGSAQRRTGGRVLHHGSIKLARTPLETEIATVPGMTSPAGLAPLLREAFETSFGVRLVPGVPTTEELEATQARQAFFGSDDFLRRR